MKFQPPTPDVSFLLSALADAILGVVASELAKNPKFSGILNKLAGEPPEKQALTRALEISYGHFVQQYPVRAVFYFSGRYLLDDEIVQELSKIFHWKQQPNTQAIEKHWRLKFPNAPDKDFQEELQFFVVRLIEEAKAQTDLREIFNGINLEEISTNTAETARNTANLLNAVQGLPENIAAAINRPVPAQTTYHPPPLTVKDDLFRTYSQVPLSGREAELNEAIKDLSIGPVMIIGIGGVGKSRLVAAVVTALKDNHTVVWYRCDERSHPDQLEELLHLHFFGPDDTTTQRPAILNRLRSHPCLIVIDNGEAMEEDSSNQMEFISIIEALLTHSARVLLTSRVEWSRLHQASVIRLDTHDLSLTAAIQIVHDMMTIYDAPSATPAQQETLAKAARRHPRLIEAAVKRLKKFPLEKTLKELEDLKGKTFEDAIQEMIGRSIAQMTTEQGPEAAVALRRLCTCKGGFTYAAAEAITQMDTDLLDAALTTLQGWNFVRFDGQTRYTVDPLVLATQPVDQEARRVHLDFYQALADEHNTHQDYAGLEVENDNLNAAFDGFIESDPAAAYWLANACYEFLLNRGRMPLYVRWMETAAVALARSDDDRLQGAVQNSLGLAYGALGQQTEPEINQRKAIAAYEAALCFCSPESAPLDYAATQNNLAVAYCELSKLAEREVNLSKAIIAYEAAQRFYTSEVAPLKYAMTQNNLGNAYGDLANLTNPEINLGNAIAAYEAALLYSTPAAAPLDYAMTQNNLGTAYQTLAGLAKRETNLGKAIAAYEAALLYSTPAAAPLDYAATQNNLGAAYWQLATLTEPETNLGKAIAAYDTALRYRTPEVAPLDYAETMVNLGIALEMQGDLARACDCWQQGEPIYRQIGYVRRADQIRGWIVNQCGG